MNISKARQNLFAMAAAATNGDRAAFTYKGITFRLVADVSVPKLSRLEPLDVLPAGVSFEDVEAALRNDSAVEAAKWNERLL